MEQKMEQEIKQLKQTMLDQEAIIEDQQALINTLKKSEIQIKEAARQITEENAKIKNENQQILVKNQEIRKESVAMEEDYFEQQKFYHSHIAKLEQRVKNYKQQVEDLKKEIEKKDQELDIQQEKNLILQLNNNSDRKSSIFNESPMLYKQNSEAQSIDLEQNRESMSKIQLQDTDLQEQMNVDEEKFQKMQKETQKLQLIFQEFKQQQKSLSKKEVINIILDNLPTSNYQVKENSFKEDTVYIEKLEQQWLNDVMPLFENEEQNLQKIVEKSRELMGKNKLVQKFRGQIWKCLIGNEAQINDQLMKQIISSFNNNPFLNADIKYTIKADLSRTYTFINQMEQSQQLKSDLQDLLFCMACYRPDIGYVQGMAYFALQLLLKMPKLDAFIGFINLFSKSKFLITIFRFQNPRMDAYFNFFNKQLQQKIPEVYDHFEELGVQKMTFLIEWAFTFYGRAFEFETVSQIWDMFFAFGDQIFFRTGLSILYTVRQQILNCEYEDCMIMLNNCSYLVSKVDLFRNMEKFKMTNSKFEQCIEKEIQLIKQEKQQKIQESLEKDVVLNQEQEENKNQEENIKQNDIINFQDKDNQNNKEDR